MKIRNPKHEIRNKHEARNPKRRVSDFGFSICFGFLISCFVLLQSLELRAQETSNHWKRLPDLPDPIGVAGAFAGVCGNNGPTGGTLLVAGGANFPDAPPWEGGKKVWHDTVWALEHPDGEWRNVGKLPTPNGYGVSVSINNVGVLCMGGGDATTNFSDVYLMSYKNGKVSFEAWPSLPMPCANACGIEYRGTVYIAGGIESPTSTTALATFWALSLERRSNGWRKLPTWPGQPRQLAVAGHVSGHFVLCGGVSLAADEAGKPMRTYLRDAFIFSTADGWTRLPDMPYSPAAAPSPFINRQWSGLITILGGDSEPSIDPKLHKGFRDELLHYSLVENEWSVGGKLSMTPRVTTPVVFWNGGYVIPSGEVRRGVRSREVWMWTP